MTNFRLCSLLISVFAFANTLGQGSTTESVDKLSIAQLIDDTVAAARKGIESAALRNSLKSIQQLADSYLNERDAKVDGQDIIAAVGEITAKDKWQLTLSALLEDPLIQEERKVTAGLYVISSMSSGIRAEKNDTLVNILVTAVSSTLLANSVGRSITIGETLYNFEKENIGNQEKRWLVFDKRYLQPNDALYNPSEYSVINGDHPKVINFAGVGSNGEIELKSIGHRGDIFVLQAQLWIRNY